jgi:hypothetical protein
VTFSGVGRTIGEVLVVFHVAMVEKSIAKDQRIRATQEVIDLPRQY